MTEKNHVFWFRRDLRISDNFGLNRALNSGKKVLPIFIFDSNILSELPKDDARVSFIYSSLNKIDALLKEKGSGLKIYFNSPENAWKKIISEYSIHTVFTNKDYEPYARERDSKIEKLLLEKGIKFQSFKDQVIFEKSEITKDDGLPYTVYTPYKKKWLSKFSDHDIKEYPVDLWENYCQFDSKFPKLSDIGFKESTQKVKDFQLGNLDNYAENRNLPAVDGTSHLSVHLRFGTVSVREIIRKMKDNEVFLSELIWREFFMQILFHFPQVVDRNFRAKYDGIKWRNNEDEFKAWCEGKTGYPLVDAGMRELNETGYMHNRVRMVVASFLIKHLLIDWRWGEAYFAKKLLDYDLSANNGNWQWSAGTGCDAAPYFRVFNPIEQLKKFDPKFKYVRKWVKDLDSFEYPTPIVEHKMARLRALETYKKGIM